MDVYEAVSSRRAVRGFKDEPVSREVLERVLSAAAWSPSGSNIQPWNIYLLTGPPLAELKAHAVKRVSQGDPWDTRQYEMYPPTLKSPYGERRSAFGRERYSALGIAREDLEARQRAAIAIPPTAVAILSHTSWRSHNSLALTSNIMARTIPESNKFLNLARFFKRLHQPRPSCF